MQRKQTAVHIAIKAVGILALYLAIARIVRKLARFPAPPFIGIFLDSDLRRMMQPPEPIIETSGIRAGMKVLEIGCGSGCYTTHVARAVGEEGEVCALDIQQGMLRQLARKLERPENRDIRNVKLHEQSAYDLPFDDSTFDVVYMITVLPEIPDPVRALAEARRVLKPEGRLALSEFLPDPDYPLLITTIQRGQQAGFEVDAVGGSVWAYTVRLRKTGETRPVEVR